jgi:hypothetical protein
LFIDAQKASEWRKRGFSPVLNEYRNTPEQNRSSSLIYRVLSLKQAHPQPTAGLAPDVLDFGLDRKQSCPKIEIFDLYEKTNPLAGMPFGLLASIERIKSRSSDGSSRARRTTGPRSFPRARKPKSPHGSAS